VFYARKRPASIASHRVGQFHSSKHVTKDAASLVDETLQNIGSLRSTQASNEINSSAVENNSSSRVAWAASRPFRLRYRGNGILVPKSKADVIGATMLELDTQLVHDFRDKGSLEQ
jgi:hypothetical protein